MPSARPATTTARSTRAADSRAPSRRAPRPRTVSVRLPLSRIRWDRKFRTVMLVVLGLVGWIGVHGMLSLLATHAQAEQQLTLVQTLARQNRVLARQARLLTQPATIVADARALGMVRVGEQAYVVTGLPTGH